MSKMPSRTTAKRTFLKERFEETKRGVPVGAKMPQSLREDSARQHGSLYRNLSLERQRHYDVAARRCVAEQQDSYRVRAEGLQARSQATRRRLSEELLATDLTNRLSDSRFGASALLALGDIVQELSTDAGALGRLRAKSQEPPSKPSEPQRQALKSCAGEISATEAPPAPQWLKVVCWNRDAFSACALWEGDLAEGECAYFLVCEPEPHACHVLEGPARWQAAPCTLR